MKISDVSRRESLIIQRPPKKKELLSHSPRSLSCSVSVCVAERTSVQLLLCAAAVVGGVHQHLFRQPWMLKIMEPASQRRTLYQTRQHTRQSSPAGRSTTRIKAPRECQPGLLAEKAAVFLRQGEVYCRCALSQESVGDGGRGDGGRDAGEIVLGAGCCRGKTHKR